jgi:hypothetical protein
MQRPPRTNEPEQQGRIPHRRRWAALVTLLPALAATACAEEPLTFPEWTVEIPDGTPVHEYRFVPPEARTELLPLERDLVLSEGMGRGLYRPGAVAVAADGTVFVLDTGNFRVVAFDQEGNALREFGRQGQGPGELQRPRGFGVAGDRVIVVDTGNNRVAAFAHDGALVSDAQLDDRLMASEIVGLDDDLLAIIAGPMPFGGSDEPPAVAWQLARYTVSGEPLAVLAERDASMKAYLYSSEMSMVVRMVYANPLGAIRPDKVAYVTGGHEYQILAIGPDGTARWALRTTYTPLAVTAAHQEAAMEEIRARDLPDMIRTEVAAAKAVWPERFAALENLETDGHGNLYAFSYAYRPPGIDPGPDNPVPVDVYAPTGELLFSGLSAIAAWDAAFGEHVYRIEEDRESGEQVVARYRVRSFE